MNIPSLEFFLDVLTSLPSFIAETNADYDAVWDWVTDQCDTDWLDEDQVTLLNAIYDHCAA